MITEKWKMRLCSGLLVMGMLWMAGCAGLSMPSPSKRVGTEGVPGSCADFFASLDQKIIAAQALDVGAFRIEGYPYLRTNRFLASFEKEINDPAVFSDWIDRLQAIDQEARHCEIANLPDPNRTEEALAAIHAQVADCGNLLKQADFKAPQTRKNLADTISAPDEYIETRRIIGVYPLARWFILHGVSDWQNEARLVFSTAPPSGWQTIIRYWPPRSEPLPATERITALVARDGLGIPIYSPEALQALFEIHAPVWEIETIGEDDRIGAPFWIAQDRLHVQTQTPTTYTLPSFTRFGEKILTQLNYIIWFPTRPKKSRLDLYGGQLDGINYRVTLDVDGTPLLYETMHNCGCYHTAYFTSRLKQRAEIDTAEPPLIFMAPAINTNSEVMTVALKGQAHNVQHLYARLRETPRERVYGYESYNRLRSLPLPSSGRRSMFGQDGIAHGSQRLERFILWPSGVYSAGAMRQWGRHAVTLVGKRHFDDPFYMEKFFETPQREDISVP